MTWSDKQDLLLTESRKYVAHDRESASLVLSIVPAGCDYIPNWVRQPSIPAWVYWTGRSFTSTNISDHVLHVTSMIRQHPREDLIIADYCVK